MSKKKHINRYKIEKSKYTYNELNNRLKDYERMKCYSFNKKDSKSEFDKLASFLPPSFTNKDEVQSIDFIVSGSTSSDQDYQHYLTFITGRIDKGINPNDQMYDYDTFSIGPDNTSTGSYYAAQSFHFKDESGNRITNRYSTKPLSTIKDKVNELYNFYLTGNTEKYSVDEFEKIKESLLKAHHQAFREIKKKM